MIFSDPKIILLHPGKTGGTSLEHTLRDKYLIGTDLGKANIENKKIMFGLSKPYNIFLQHADLRFYINELSYDLNKFTTISTVRRPYERLLSCYYYNGKSKKFTFREFILNNLEKCIEANSKYAINHFCPQIHYVQYNNYIVNHIIKLENFVDDCKSIGIDINYNYSKTTGTKKYADYMDAYDEEMKRRVYELYKEDFITLGYDK